MIFRNYKKTFTIIGIIAILLPVFFLAGPQKAKAVVPVIDAKAIVELTALNVSNTLIAENTTSLVAKEFSLDTIAYLAAGVVLKAITNSVVAWIKSGFQGQPGFITDPAAFFQDAADQATGRFFKMYLSPAVYNSICSPFRADLLLGLKSTNTYEQRMRCTLSTVLANAQNGVQFGVALRNGDWGDWMSATLNSQNNPSGALLISLNELDTRRANARNIAKTESIFNAGFLSMKTCDMYQVDGWTGEKTCIGWKTTSPGKWVSDTLSQATGIDMQRLAVADEINEILSALLSQLLTGILRR